MLKASDFRLEGFRLNIVVTGAEGFLGRNLMCRLKERSGYGVVGIGRGHDWEEVRRALTDADIVFHLAGVNRPDTEDDFVRGNVELTARLGEELRRNGRQTPVVFASSIQAVLDNPYGRSKREAERVLGRYSEESGADVAVYRLPNVFGKWCRPNYNSVVATFCHNIARDLPISVSDPRKVLTLAYVDDVVEAFIGELDGRLRSSSAVLFRDIATTYEVSLGRLAELLQGFRQSRESLAVADHGDAFIHKLYATYLSYLDPDNFAYDLQQRVDARGALAEFVKTESFGQIFVSRTKPGITRGNHYHHTKTEKFLVLEGKAIIRFRAVDGGEVIEYPVRGEDFRVVDIPPGYTHSIENVGSSELVTLFWASEIFEPDRPDTYGLPVLEGRP